MYIIIIIKFKLTTWLLQLIRQMNLQMLSLFYHIAWWIRVGAANGLYSSAFVLHYIPDKVHSIDNACLPSSMLSTFLGSCWMPLSPATTLSLCDNNECHAHNCHSVTQLTSPSCRFKFPPSSYYSPSNIQYHPQSWSAATSLRALDWVLFARKTFSMPCSHLHHALENRSSKSKESKFQDKLCMIWKRNNPSFQCLERCSSFDLNAMILSI